MIPINGITLKGHKSGTYYNTQHQHEWDVYKRTGIFGLGGYTLYGQPRI